MSKPFKFNLKSQGRVLTKAQKLAKTAATKANKVTRNISKQGPKYAGIHKGVATNKPLTRRQYMKLQKMAHQTERMDINAKPEIIRATGQALAYNTASPAAGISTSAVLNSAQQSNNDAQIQNLIKGGIGQAGKDNDEEETSLPGGLIIR